MSVYVCVCVCVHVSFVIVLSIKFPRAYTKTQPKIPTASNADVHTTEEEEEVDEEEEEVDEEVEEVEEEVMHHWTV